MKGDSLLARVIDLDETLKNIFCLHLIALWDSFEGDPPFTYEERKEVFLVLIKKLLDERRIKFPRCQDSCRLFY